MTIGSPQARRFGSFCLLLAMVASACSSAAVVADGQRGPALDESAPTASAEPTPPVVAMPDPTEPASQAPVPTPTVAVELDAAAPEGWAAEYVVGACFNLVDDQPGPAINCDGEHEFELYRFFGLPGGPDDYPAADGLGEELWIDFCEIGAVDFGGGPNDEIPFSISYFAPTADQWRDEGDRTLVCAAGAANREENIFKVGTAAGGSLDSDDGVVARSTVDGRQDLYVSFEASDLYPLTGGEYLYGPTSPQAQAQRVYFAGAPPAGQPRSTSLYELSLVSGEVIEVSFGLEGWEIASPHGWANDASLVFAARQDDRSPWGIYGSPGGVASLLTAEGIDSRWPTLTPDESQIVFSQLGNIWIMNIDGSDQRQLTNDPNNDYESAVSPDGETIVFASDRSGNDDIWIMNIDGSDQRQLIDHPANEAWPFFSTDGGLIYFQTDRLGVRSNLMMMRPDGTNVSYFSFEFMTNAALLPEPIADRLREELELADR